MAIEITPDNDAPVASRDFKTTADDDEIVSLDPVSNDADIDGDQLSGCRLMVLTWRMLIQSVCHLVLR